MNRIPIGQYECINIPSIKAIKILESLMNFYMSLLPENKSEIFHNLYSMCSAEEKKLIDKDLRYFFMKQ